MVYAVEEMSTNSTIGQKSNGEFAVSNQFFAESSSTTIGNQAALRVESGSSINDFSGIVCGTGNTIQVEADVNIAGLRLEIDGDENAVILGKASNSIIAGSKFTVTQRQGIFAGRGTASASERRAALPTQ